MLADLLNCRPQPLGVGATAELLRHLCSTSADHLRLAEELESVARQHRLAEQGLRPGLEELLAAWEVELDAVNTQQAGHLQARKPTWLRRLVAGRNGSTALITPSPSLVITTRASNMAQELPLTAVAREADIYVRMLGPFDVFVAGERVSRWRSLKGRALFQFLLLHADRPVRREVLMETFWPQHSHRSARNNLNVSFYGLRQSLDPSGRLACIVYKEDCYQLNSELSWWIDKSEFLIAVNAARPADDPRNAILVYKRAIALYRGQLLDGERTSDWYLSEQHHLRELYLQAVEQLGELLLDAHALEQAVEAGELALANDASRESAHRLLMRCYARLQRNDLVSRQLRRCIAVLRDELGVRPSSATVSLFHELTTNP
jgi:DNA-binding SARP family transcriptional activator